MARSLNRVTLLGNVGRDPETRVTTGGTKVCNLTMATEERWKDPATGEQKEKTDWHRVTIWGGLVEVAEKNIRKGSKIYVAGKLQTREWMDKDGKKQFSTEIHIQGYSGELILLDAHGEVAPRPAPKAATPPQRNREDDDIPF